MDCSWAQIESSVETVMRRTRFNLECFRCCLLPTPSTGETRATDNG